MRQFKAKKYEVKMLVLLKKKLETHRMENKTLPMKHSGSYK